MITAGIFSTPALSQALFLRCPDMISYLLSSICLTIIGTSLAKLPEDKQRYAEKLLAVFVDAYTEEQK